MVLNTIKSVLTLYAIICNPLLSKEDAGVNMQRLQQGIPGRDRPKDPL